MCLSAPGKGGYGGVAGFRTPKPQSRARLALTGGLGVEKVAVAALQEGFQPFRTAG